jgi:hypothetical protein
LLFRAIVLTLHSVQGPSDAGNDTDALVAKGVGCPATVHLLLACALPSHAAVLMCMAVDVRTTPGVVTTEPCGSFIYYILDPEVLGSLADELAALAAGPAGGSRRRPCA